MLGVVRIPEGPNADLDAATAGKLPYSPAEVRAPVFVVYGNYDVVVDDAGASAFLERFTASPLKWRISMTALTSCTWIVLDARCTRASQLSCGWLKRSVDLDQPRKAREIA